MENRKNRIKCLFIFILFYLLGVITDVFVDIIRGG